MPKIAIIGAGSIGCHLSFSSRKMGWNVTVFDNSEAALNRMRNDIYPKRYGSWDSQITICTMNQFKLFPVSTFDVIMIGTPPDTHVELIKQCLFLKPRILLTEKPLCPPSQNQLESLNLIFSKNKGTKFLVGYNHRVSRVIHELKRMWKNHGSLSVKNLEVRWLEDWSGILKAHPWLNGPEDSYLGFTERGGGALFEHSHGLDLWLHLSTYFGLGSPSELRARVISDDSNQSLYTCEESIGIEIMTDKGFVGSVFQDVKTSPPIKQVVVSDSEFNYTLDFHIEGTSDRILVSRVSSQEIIQEALFSKKRYVDFDEEIYEIERLLSHGDALNQIDSPLDALTGLETVKLAAKSLLSADVNERVILG